MGGGRGLCTGEPSRLTQGLQGTLPTAQLFSAADSRPLRRLQPGAGGRAGLGSGGEGRDQPSVSESQARLDSEHTAQLGRYGSCFLSVCS